MEMIEKYQLLVLLSIGMLPVCIAVATIRIISFTKEHKNLISYYSRYIATRQATNDIMEVIVYNLASVHNLIMQAKDVVQTHKTGQDRQSQAFDDATNDFNSWVSQLPADNRLSVDRSYTAENLQRQKVSSPLGTIFFWLPTASSLALLIYFYYDHTELPINIAILTVIIVIEIGLFYISIGRINQTLHRKQNVEKKLINTLNLFDIRRIFIKDTVAKLNQHLDQLNKFEDYCRDISEAASYSRGIDILKLNIHHMENVYDITDINVVTPLISVSPILQKSISGIYGPAAAEHSVKLINNLQPGLSFHMSQANIAKLIDPLVLDAIKFSPAGQTVTINGVPKPHRVEIEVIDNTQRIPESQTPNLFRFDSKKAQLPESGYFNLDLRIAKLIVSTEGGEIKVSGKKDGATSIKLSIPKNRSHEVIKISPTISKTSTPIN